MHYAHLSLETFLVTLDTTPYVKSTILLAKSHDRKLLVGKIEQLVDSENRLVVDSLEQVYERLTGLGLMSDPKDVWISLVSHRSAILDYNLCGCPACSQLLEEILE